jgi:hypothetical protein
MVVHDSGRRGFGGPTPSTASEQVLVSDAITPNSTMQVGYRGSHGTSWQSSRPSSNANVAGAGLSAGGPLSSPQPNCVLSSQETFSPDNFVTARESYLADPSVSTFSGPVAAAPERVLQEPQPTTSPSVDLAPWIFSPRVNQNAVDTSTIAHGERMFSHNTSSGSATVSSIPSAPAISNVPAVSTPMVSEAVLVSTGPVSTPVIEQSTNIATAGNELLRKGDENARSGSLLSEQGNNLSAPVLSEAQINSAIDTLVRSNTPAKAGSGWLSAPSPGQNGSASSQPPTTTNELNRTSQPPQEVIDLSDDD